MQLGSVANTARLSAFPVRHNMAINYCRTFEKRVWGERNKDTNEQSLKTESFGELIEKTRG
jgi:hypothetical protein